VAKARLIRASGSGALEDIDDCPDVADQNQQAQGQRCRRSALRWRKGRLRVFSSPTR
jgi:hypothetical protein